MLSKTFTLQDSNSKIAKSLNVEIRGFWSTVNILYLLIINGENICFPPQTVEKGLSKKNISSSASKASWIDG